MANVKWEVVIMQHLADHFNIVSFKGAFDDTTIVHLVMELCGGDMIFYHIITRRYYTEWEVATLIRAVMEVVKACHRCGVMYQDLKSKNFLFVNKSKDSPMKVIDFGLLKFFKRGQRLFQIVGTLLTWRPRCGRKVMGWKWIFGAPRSSCTRCYVDGIFLGNNTTGDWTSSSTWPSRLEGSSMAHNVILCQVAIAVHVGPRPKSLLYSSTGVESPMDTNKCIPTSMDVNT
jgi:serine/threonine protein kinase